MKLQRLRGEQSLRRGQGRRFCVSGDAPAPGRIRILQPFAGDVAGGVPDVDPQKWTAERRTEHARKWGGQAKPPDLSAIMRRAPASLGKGSTYGSGDHGG